MITETWTRARSRPRRALYLSSPIGLGHARRDLAIAQELKVLHPDLQIDWLTQHPVTRVLEDAGERVHPASAWLASESAHIEAESGEHDLHVFGALRGMDEILVNNFMVFNDVVEETPYDLVIGDEAWDVDYFLHENPELKRFSFAWLTDFVGLLPMPDLGEREALLTADYNAEMLEQRARHRRVRDQQIFVGNPEDVVDELFGPGLPNIREWTVAHYDFAGYITGFEPPTAEEVARARRELGYGVEDMLCIVAVGGSGVGEPLLRRLLDAVPAARAHVPNLKFLVVTGPRIDPGSLPSIEGVDIRGYVPDLYLRMAAADVAVVQGGLTTTMELAAAGVPFLYVPLRHHFEQNFHVSHRLQNYRAGRRVDYSDVSDPEWLAAEIVKQIDSEVDSLPVESGGAERRRDVGRAVVNDTEANDKEAVTATALDYFEGWYDADLARVDRALHPHLVKRSVDQVRSENPSVMTKERMLGLVREGGGVEDKTRDPIEVTVADVHHDIATAVVRSAQYREYLHLLRTPDGWKIAGAFWQLTDPEQQSSA